MLTRRTLLAAPAGLALAAQASAARTPPGQFCLNTSTIRMFDGKVAKPRPVAESIEIAAKAGYQAIEPWVAELEAFVKDGGTVAELRRRVADSGLALANAIGFAEWIVADPARRQKGLDQAKRDMDLVRELGGTSVAAPPVGATAKDAPAVSLAEASDRYAHLLELGQSCGVRPLVEVWGFSRTLARLGETWYVAAECGRPGGGLLPDIYHLYKGGSDFAGLKLLSAEAVGIFHVNDYPKISREAIQDADRVYPGDGQAPVREVFAALKAIGYSGYLSLELFNRTYWRQDPHAVARAGLDKMRALWT